MHESVLNSNNFFGNQEIIKIMSNVNTYIENVSRMGIENKQKNVTLNGKEFYLPNNIPYS